MGDPRPYDDRPSKLRPGFVPPSDRFSISNILAAVHRGSSESGAFGGSDSNFHPEELPDSEDRPYKGEMPRSGGSGAGGMLVSEQPYNQNQPELSMLLKEYRAYQSDGGLLSFTDWLENDHVEKHYQSVTLPEDYVSEKSESYLNEDGGQNQDSTISETNRDLKNGILGAWKLPQEERSSGLSVDNFMAFDNERVERLVKGPGDKERLLGFCHAMVGNVEQFGVGVCGEDITEYTAITSSDSFTIKAYEFREMFGLYPRSAAGGAVIGFAVDSQHSKVIVGNSSVEEIGRFFLGLGINGIRPGRESHVSRGAIFYKYTTNPKHKE